MIKHKPLTRDQVKEGLDTVPVSSILGSTAAKQLTAKQRRFAMEVAKGQTKAGAYRTAYNANPAPSTIITSPYKLSADPRIKQEIEAYERALLAQEYRTPAALRALVVQSLAEIVLNADIKPAVRVQAAKVLGTVTEVAAFTERKEITTIKRADDARAQVLQYVRQLAKSTATDALDVSAQSLLDELTPEKAENTVENDSSDPHPPPTPLIDDGAAPNLLHINPHKLS